MSTTTLTLEQRILAVLAQDAAPLADLAHRLREDAATVLRALQQLGSLKQVICHREDGVLLWDVAEAAALPAMPVGPAVVATSIARPGPVEPIAPLPPLPASKPAKLRAPRRPAPRRNAGVTDGLRDALRSTPWLSAGDLLQRLPDVERDVIYALLSQRVKAGEFIAYPAVGRNRRYALAGAALPQSAVTPLHPRRARRPQLHPTIVGVATAFERCLRFITWAQALHGEPAWQLIQAEFGVSRATAYRWLGGWNAAREALAA